MTQAYIPTVPELERPPLIPARVSVIAGITAATVIVFAGAYFAGRAARPDSEPLSDVRARVEIGAQDARGDAPPRAEPQPVARAADQASAELDSGEPQPAEAAASAPDPAAPFETFDLRRLHPEVATAVASARDVRVRAQDAEARAREAAVRAEAEEEGTRVITYENGDVYAGEVSLEGRSGVGVYTWANPREGDYAGEFAEDAMDGLGVKRWADGATYFGDRRREAREGFGVFVYADGGGYEGQWLNGAPDGHGVVWTPQGEVRAQGVWSGNTLVEAWIMPPPDDETDE